jgi:hypothetical protein
LAETARLNMTHFKTGDEPIIFAEEMELRDYFAAKAMQGIMGLWKDGYERVFDNQSYCAKHAYEIADAMMKEREK